MRFHDLILLNANTHLLSNHLSRTFGLIIILVIVTVIMVEVLGEVSIVISVGKDSGMVCGEMVEVHCTNQLYSL